MTSGLPSSSDIDKSLSRLTATLGLVEAPVMVLAEWPLRIVWLGEPARCLLGEHRVPSLPIELDRVLGPYVVGQLEGLFRDDGAEAPRSIELPCLVAAGRHRLRFSCRPVAANDRLWVVTLADAGPPPSGEWRQDLVEILNLLPVGVEVFDSNLEALFFNRFSDSLFDYVEKPVIHHDDWWELGFPDETERAKARSEWDEKLAALSANPDATQSIEFWVRTADDRRRRLEFRFRFVGDKLLFMELDVTEQRLLEEELRRLVNVDPLTGAASRRSFLETGRRAFAESRAGAGHLCVVMLDVDHFKQINDRYGHAVGDEVLAAVGARLRARLAPSDIFARIGGEEFALAFSSITREMDLQKAEHLRRQLEAAPIGTTEGPIQVCASFGVARYRTADTALEDLLRRADAALYEAKAAGRNRVCLAPDE